MIEPVKTEQPSVILYEELLLKRENLRREGAQFRIAYLNAFGALIMESFRKKVECIQKKKAIAYCRKMANQGRDIIGRDLRRFIEEEMRSYLQDLQTMKSEIRNAETSESVSAEDQVRIRDLYYGIARRIHPDMRPDLAGDKTLKEYWNRAVLAYRYNSLEELEELDVLIRAYLSESGIGERTAEIENIEMKIMKTEQEIERILSSNPYLYRLILEDSTEMEKHRKQLQEECETYRKYSEELDEVLKQFEIREMFA